MLKTHKKVTLKYGNLTNIPEVTVGVGAVIDGANQLHLKDVPVFGVGVFQIEGGGEFVVDEDFLDRYDWDGLLRGKPIIEDHSVEFGEISEAKGSISSAYLSGGQVVADLVVYNNDLREKIIKKELTSVSIAFTLNDYGIIESVEHLAIVDVGMYPHGKITFSKRGKEKMTEKEAELLKEKAEKDGNLKSTAVTASNAKKVSNKKPEKNLFGDGFDGAQSVEKVSNEDKNEKQVSLGANTGDKADGESQKEEMRKLKIQMAALKELADKREKELAEEKEGQARFKVLNEAKDLNIDLGEHAEKSSDELKVLLSDAMKKTISDMQSKKPSGGFRIENSKKLDDDTIDPHAYAKNTKKKTDAYKAKMSKEGGIESYSIYEPIEEGA